MRVELLFFVYILSTSFIAGIIGSLLGLGGGIILVPALTILFDMPIHEAIGLSFIGVLVNSSSSSLVYIKNGITDIRLSSILEIGAVIGSIIGAYTALSIDSNVLSIIFGIVLGYVSIDMYRKTRTMKENHIKRELNSGEEREYFEESTKKMVKYSLLRKKEGIILSSVGGIFAGLLGVGGGAIFVPIMNRIMNVPIKVAIATSSFMIGVTSLVGMLIFFNNGFIDVRIISPIIIGIFFGAQIGSRINMVINKRLLTNIFILVIIYIAFRMVTNGLEIEVFNI
tara:strand:+ start:963 stop:1811 length:849 start_codon:yes stop_codon:yes gene_type:complete